jgi:hypothetical protein
MKAIFLILGLIILLSACTSNVAYSNDVLYFNKEYNIIENKNFIFTWAEADSYEEALFQCKKQVVKCCYSEVLNGDPDQDWMAIMTSISNEKVIDSFIIRDTGRHCVSIKVFKNKNKHLIKRE